MRQLSKIEVISAVAVWLGCAVGGWSVALLTPGDFIIGIDLDSWGSKYRTIEGPAKVYDGLLTTKYLNYGIDNSGFIVTPTFGPSIVQSMRLTTANDREERDPASFELYGTNAPIASLDDSDGTAEPWTLIASGPLALPAARQTVGPVVNLGNAVSYASYKLIFPTVKRNTTTMPNSMQICEVEVFTGPNATGMNVLGTGGPILAIDRDLGPQSSVPVNEGPAFAIDNRPNKYLNYGRANSGFIVTPWAGATVVTAFQIMTANDNPSRDPTTYALYGTNDAILSIDNSNGDKENWTLIASGSLSLPTDRIALAPAVMITNSRPYISYRMVFPTLRDALATDSMQIGEIQFYGSIAFAAPTTPLLNPGDLALAIDSDTDVSASSYPAVETPAMACDGVSTTKYLNFAKENSGIIAAPVSGPSVVRSLRLTTGNDSPERDPTTFTLYGTNAPIVSRDNSRGLGESWALIASSVLAPPTERTSPYPVVTFENAASYSSYKLLFPTLRESAIADSMQVTEIELFTSPARPDNVLLGGGMFLAVDSDIAPASSYPIAEGPAAAIDHTLTKYLNFGRANSGFIVKPLSGRTVVNAIHLTSANDHTERDPMTWTLYGTMDPVVSVDNSQGTSENWTLIASGSTGLPLDRNRLGPVVDVANTAAYDAYKLLFDSLREGADAPANSVQIGEIQFYGTIRGCSIPFADADGDGDVDQADFGAYQSCFTGPGIPHTTYECRCLDRDNDGDIDIGDFTKFEKCVTGPAITWTQALTPDCVP